MRDEELVQILSVPIDSDAELSEHSKPTIARMACKVVGVAGVSGGGAADKAVGGSVYYWRLRAGLKGLWGDNFNGELGR